MNPGAIYESHIEFLNPEWLLALPLVVVLGFFSAYLMRERKVARETLGYYFFSDLPLGIIIPTITAGLLAIALARPSIGTYRAEVPQKTQSIFIAVDVSLSMRVKDVPPNRLTLVRRKLLDLLGELRERGTSARVSIILFSGSAVVYCPLTADFDVLELYIRKLSTNLLSSKGSSLDDALSQIEETAQELKLERFSAAVFSDGEFSRSSELKKYPFKVFTFGVGTMEGGPIPLRGGSLQKDSSGNIVQSVLREDALKLLARNTSASYQRLGLGTGAIENYANSVQSLAETNQEDAIQQVTQKREVFHYVLWTLLAFLTLFYLLPARAGVLLLLLVPLLIYPGKAALAESSSVTKGKEAYQTGDFEKAKEYFKEAIRVKPNDELAQFGLGSSLYRLKDYREAEKTLKTLASESKNGRVVFESLYNAGNSALGDQNPKNAIEYYERALHLLPEDPKTTFNLELAKKLLEQQQQSSQQEQNQKQEQEQEQANQEEENSKQENSEKESQQDQQSGEEENSEGEQQESENNKEPQNDESSESKEQEGRENEEKSDDSQKEQDANNGEQKEDQKGEEEKKDASNQEKDGTEKGDEEKTEGKESSAEGNPESMEGTVEQEAARKWLDSLPESPLLLPQYKKKENVPGGQLW